MSLQQRHSHDGDPFAAPDETHSLVSLGLDAYIVSSDSEDIGKGLAHGRGMRRQSGMFENDGDICLDQVISPTVDYCVGCAQETHGVGVLPLGVVIGEKSADIARPSGTEDCVGKRVGYRVRVRVAGEPFLERNPLAGKDQRAPDNESVGVVAEAYAHNGAAGQRRGGAASGAAGQWGGGAAKT